MLEIADQDIKNQYELLGILDGKSASLLTFNTIFLATISVWLGYVPLNFMHLALDFVFLALLVSCAFLLAVIRLRWATAGESVSELNDVRHYRTAKYHKAWKISVASVGAVIVVSTIHTVGTALTASGICRGGCAWFYGQEIFGNLDAKSPEKSDR